MSIPIVVASLGSIASTATLGGVRFRCGIPDSTLRVLYHDAQTELLDFASRAPNSSGTSCHNIAGFRATNLHM